MTRPLFAALLLAPLAGLPALAAPDPHDGEDGGDSPYRKAVIDVGVIVSDIDAAEDFYEDALGFHEVNEFDVAPEVAGASGLTAGAGFTADVMAIGYGEDATKIKLIEMPTAPGARPDNRFIHSSYGPSYLTLHVRDIDAALKRAADHGVKPLKSGPVAVNEEGTTFIALIRDPDGNFIELVGPRAAPAGETTPETEAEAEMKPDGPAENAAEAAGEAVDDAAAEVGEELGEAADALDD